MSDWDQAALDEHIAAAERKGKWLFSGYQGLWFSPAELRTANANGRFRWGPVNWELRDPQELIAQYTKDIERKIVERDQVIARIGASAHV